MCVIVPYWHLAEEERDVVGAKPLTEAPDFWADFFTLTCLLAAGERDLEISFLLLEAPVDFKRPLLDFFAAVLVGTDLVKVASYFFNWPSLELRFLVWELTWVAIKLSKSSVSAVVSVFKREVVSAVASSSMSEV